MVLSCTDIHGNADGDWVGGIAGQLGQDGNICCDPLYCDPQEHDFTLHADSPCAPAHSGGCGQIGACPVGCGIGTAVDDVAAAGALAALLPNVPNPFNPATEIRFTLAVTMPVRLSVHELTGRRVAVLADRVFDAGEQVVVWRGRDGDGRPVPSGRYVAVLEAAGMRVSRGLTLLR